MILTHFVEMLIKKTHYHIPMYFYYIKTKHTSKYKCLWKTQKESKYFDNCVMYWPIENYKINITYGSKLWIIKNIKIDWGEIFNLRVNTQYGVQFWNSNTLT